MTTVHHEVPEATAFAKIWHQGRHQSPLDSMLAFWRFARLGDQAVELLVLEADRWRHKEASRYPKYRGTCVGYATTALDALALGNVLEVYPVGYYARPCGVTENALARYPHDLDWHAAVGGTVGETEVTPARVLAIDVDPAKTTGTNGTNDQAKEAFRIAWRIRETLVGCGVPDRALALGLSGNGAHLLLAQDCPWNPQVRAARIDLLRVLGALFTCDGYSIDCIFRTHLNTDSGTT